jgi:hypothetical protein
MMAVKYRLYYDDVMKHKDVIGTDKPVEIEVMDFGGVGMEWMRTKSLISQQPIEGGEAVALVGPFGGVVEEGKWFVKIVEKLPPELEEH